MHGWESPSSTSSIGNTVPTGAIIHNTIVGMTNLVHTSSMVTLATPLASTLPQRLPQCITFIHGDISYEPPYPWKHLGYPRLLVWPTHLWKLRHLCWPQLSYTWHASSRTSTYAQRPIMILPCLSNILASLHPTSTMNGPLWLQGVITLRVTTLGLYVTFPLWMLRKC